MPNNDIWSTNTSVNPYDNQVSLMKTLINQIGPQAAARQRDYMQSVMEMMNQPINITGMPNMGDFSSLYDSALNQGLESMAKFHNYSDNLRQGQDKRNAIRRGVYNPGGIAGPQAEWFKDYLAGAEPARDAAAQGYTAQVKLAQANAQAQLQQVMAQIAAQMKAQQQAAMMNQMQGPNLNSLLQMAMSGGQQGGGTSMYGSPSAGGGGGY